MTCVMGSVVLGISNSWLSEKEEKLTEQLESSMSTEYSMILKGMVYELRFIVGPNSGAAIMLKILF